jgi:hypothetical protein
MTPMLEFFFTHFVGLQEKQLRRLFLNVIAFPRPTTMRTVICPLFIREFLSRR